MGTDLEFEPLKGTAFERIRDSWVPIWLKGFERKARDYNSAATGWEPHEFLGIKGQFADVWRKIGKLKKSLWDDETLEGEQPLEIIDDLISHLFLTRDLLLRQEAEQRRTRQHKPSNNPEAPLWLLSPGVTNDIVDYANKAVKGDPSLLEEAGWILMDGPTEHCGLMCVSGHHQFHSHCAYRIKKRRNDG